MFQSQFLLYLKSLTISIAFGSKNQSMTVNEEKIKTKSAVVKGESSYKNVECPKDSCLAKLDAKYLNLDLLVY